MGKIDLFEVEKLHNYRWEGPRYYAHPDGEDLIGKLKFATIISTSTGLLLGGVAACSVVKAPKSFQGKLLQTAQFLVPCVGAAITFTAATYFSTRLRGKDDEINYVIGGFLSGASLATLTPWRELGVLGALIFPVLGYYRKWSHMNGGNWFSTDPSLNFSSYYLRNWDFSIIKESPGHWTRDPVSKEKSGRNN